METLRALGLDWRVLLVQIVTFGVLYWLLRRYLFGPVSALLSARSSEVEQRLASAQHTEEHSQQLRQELESRLSTIEEEARQKIQQAVQEARTARERLMQEARGDAERVLRRAEEEIQREQRRALLDLRNQVADLAIAAAEKAVAAGLDEAKHRQAIADYLVRLEAESQ